MGGGPDNPTLIKVEDGDKPFSISQATANMAINPAPFPSERTQLEEELNFLRSNPKHAPNLASLYNPMVDTAVVREERARLSLEEEKEWEQQEAEQLGGFRQAFGEDNGALPSEKVQLSRELKALGVSLKPKNYDAALDEPSWGDEDEEDGDYESGEVDEEEDMERYSDIEAEELDKEDSVVGDSDVEMT